MVDNIVKSMQCENFFDFNSRQIFSFPLMFFLTLFLGCHSIYYEPSVAMKNLYLSYAAYCDPSQVQNWSCKWCSQWPAMERVQIHSESLLGTFGFTGYDRSSSTGTQNVTRKFFFLSRNKKNILSFRFFYFVCQ